MDLWGNPEEVGWLRELRTATELTLYSEKGFVISVLLSFSMLSGNRAQQHFLRLPEIINLVGVTRSTPCRWMEAGNFPKQIQLCPCSVVWNEQEVIKWMEDQMASI